MYYTSFKNCFKIKKKSSNWYYWFFKKRGEFNKKILKKNTNFKAGNMSLGVNLLMYLTEIASKSLNNNFLQKFMRFIINIKKIIHQEQL